MNALAVLAAAAAGPWQSATIRRELRPSPASGFRVVGCATTSGVIAAVVAATVPAGLLPAVVSFIILGLPAAVIDARSGRLPNRLTLPAYPVLTVTMIAGSIAAGSADRLLPAAVGAGCALAFFAVQLLIFGRRGPGRGDLKLAGSCGLLLGWIGPLAWVAGFLTAYLIHLAGAAALGVTRRSGLRGHHPLGPGLVAGTLLALTALSGLD